MIEIDIRAELEEFSWHNAKWLHDKLIAASPFRYDRTPSFFVRLEPWGDYPAGIWSDSGAYDSEFESGDFVKLLSFLRDETREETEEYLTGKYGYDESGRVVLVNRELKRAKQFRTLSDNIVTCHISPYLSKRGISAEVQSAAGVGYGQHRGFCALPWKSADGRLLNVKYRATKGKAFFYEKDATPIRKIIYGADTVKPSDQPLVICEAEIDALSWRTAGFQAVAIGGVGFSESQADILKRLPVSSFALAGDNDKAGQRFNARAIERLSGARLSLIQYCDESKDANDVLKKAQGVETLRQMFLEALELPTINRSQLSIR